jgi:hypothetical protein
MVEAALKKAHRSNASSGGMNEVRRSMECCDRNAWATHLSPILFVDYEQAHPIPASLAQISTCDMMTIEILKEVMSEEPPLGRYEGVPNQILRGRGASSGLLY